MLGSPTPKSASLLNTVPKQPGGAGIHKKLRTNPPGGFCIQLGYACSDVCTGKLKKIQDWLTKSGKRENIRFTNPEKSET